MRGASWGDDGFIVFTPNSQEGIWRIKDTGGTPERLTTVDTAKHEKTHRLPDVLPGGKGVLFMIGTTEVDTWDDSTIAVLPPSGGPPKPVVKGGMMPRYVAPGYLVYAHGGDLLAAPFDLDRLEVTGPAVSVSSDVAMTNTMGVAEAAFSATGLAYLPGHNSAALSSLVEADRAGVTRPVTPTPRIMVGARWLPDARVLFNVDTGNAFVWLFDTRRDAFVRLTFHNDASTFAWNQATGKVLYGSAGALIAVSPDGTGHEDVVYRSNDVIGDLDVSRDGQLVIFDVLDGATSQLRLLHTATGKVEAWLPSRFNQMQPRFSPDGRWVAYVSNEAGRPEVYVSATSGGEAKIQASTAAGVLPAWGPDGRELFYSAGTRIMVADVNVGTSIAIGTPRPLFQLPERSLFQDVAADGQHFLLLQPGPQPAPQAITYVSGWLESIKAKTGR
jgi:serine/threonine-protein kinase